MKNPFRIEAWRTLYRHHFGALIAFQSLVLVLVGFVLAQFLNGRSDERKTALVTTTAAAPTAGPSMWTCSMHPQIRQPNPGDCPICGMDLIPVATQSGGLRTLSISPEARALMSIDSTPVQRRYVSHEIRMVGKVDYDQTKFGYITAWVPGRLDRLYVDYSGVAVEKGDHMVYIYSPELFSAQEELIQALKYREDRQRAVRLTPSLDLVESAREKLRLLGLSDEQIQAIEQQDRPSDRITINSPVSGIVVEKMKQEGDYVNTGERIYTVADLNQVWVHLDAYESELSWIRYGQDVAITTEAYPGETFHGRIAFIQPVMNDRTRTVQVRVNVPNTDGKLKPDMFVHAIVRPQVAAGGRVMDPNLAGKWISPMHPEIIKDEPGSCDICGMPLVRAETLGYVTPETDAKQAPLVIPRSAALVTGTRAVVYVELPEMPQGVDACVEAIATSLQAESLDEARNTFGVLGDVLDRPYAQRGSDYARNLWNQYADELAPLALAGMRLSTIDEAKRVLSNVDVLMDQLHEQFAPIGQPTFEGREIVLGPRAGNFYLVRNGVEEGEMVVTEGNFKVDAEIQIQAKPSMMTPQGGRGGGHDHGDQAGGAMPAGGEGHAGHKMPLPTEFKNQIADLEVAYQQVAEAIRQADAGAAAAAFAQFGRTLAELDGTALTGYARIQWKEFAMLLGNDAMEGENVSQMHDADRVFVLLKNHMRRMREQLGIAPDQQREVEQIAVSPEFQVELAAIWAGYLAIQQALAADQLEDSQQALAGFQSAVAAVAEASLTGRANVVWDREKANLTKLISGLQGANSISSFRNEFKPLSEEIGVLAKSFGFGETRPVFELHCPMAFQGQGAVWYQDNKQVRNPYYGATMLKCADRVDQLTSEPPASHP